MEYHFAQLGVWTRRIIWTCGIIALVVLTTVSFYIFSYRAPANFPDSAIIAIDNGKSLTDIADELKAAHIIRSPFWFINFIIILKREKGIVGGTYNFDHPMSVYQIAKRLANGTYNMAQLKTTIPEGSNIFDISQIMKRHYPTFDDIHFLTIARTKEGYLFPDTYVFGVNTTPEQVVSVMNETFDQKIKDPQIQQAIATSGHSLTDIVTMASILEGEARQMQTRRIVAGILWKRIELGIPLQVDAAFRYVNGKTTEQLTASDLKIDSPYNTYIYKGLTPTPISNPGLDSILAAATPISTQYLYFLTDKDGNMHYAMTLEEHAANKQKYLGN